MVRSGRPLKRGELRQKYGVTILPSVREKAYEYGINMSKLLEDSLEAEFKRRDDEIGN